MGKSAVVMLVLVFLTASCVMVAKPARALLWCFVFQLSAALTCLLCCGERKV